MYHPILRSSAQRQIKALGHADLVIGLPSYKNTEPAVHVARLALAGAHRHYPALRVVLINADAGAKATTRQAVATLAANGYSGQVVTGRYQGTLGQGSATAALLDAGLALDARAIVILDSHTHTITPDWIVGLAHLVLENKADLVMPRYHWCLPDGALSDLVVYPFFRAVWGRSIRHPAAPDFAISPELATALLDEDIWETGAAAFGLPVWLATYALLGNWRVAQSALGEKRSLADLIQPQHDLDAERMAGDQHFKERFQNIISLLWQSVYARQQEWAKVAEVQSLPTITEFTSGFEVEPGFDLDNTPLLDRLALGWIEYRLLWQRILTAENLARIEALASLPPDRFYFPSDLWARIVYDFAVAFSFSEDDPCQIVNSFFPLYQGRLAAFWQEVAGLSVVGREGTVAAQAVEFEELRPYFATRWAAGRPRPDIDEPRPLL